jgi:hypothetical protein
MTHIETYTVDARVRIPTPFNNSVEINITVPDTDTVDVRLYQDATSTSYRSMVPGSDASFSLKAGESFYWSSADGTTDAHPTLVGTGW